MMRNPETAYLASDEEFDRQLDELGWSPSDLVTEKDKIKGIDKHQKYASP